MIIVLVEWVDSRGGYGWQPPDGDTPPCSCRTVGFYVGNPALLGQEDVRLVFGKADNEQVYCPLVIPMSAVRKITQLAPEPASKVVGSEE